MKACFQRHACDKLVHGYELVYEPLFSQFRFEPIRLLEVGIFRGASIAAWLDYFPNAEITGIDTFQRLQPDRIPILKHPRVKWIASDSAHAVLSGKFDAIIDDGCHAPKAQRETFLNLQKYMGGVYFIEDIQPVDTKAEEFRLLMDALSPYKVTRHDLRKSRRPDSYLIEIR